MNSQRNRAYESSKKSLYFSAREDFDSFMLHIEIDRPLHDRFWSLRQNSKMYEVCDGLQQLADDKLDILFVACPLRVGKLLSDDTPVMTRNGWEKHGDLTVGYEVISPNGQYVKVTRIHPKNTANYRVIFSNNETVDCQENHEWVVIDRQSLAKRIKKSKI